VSDPAEDLKQSNQLLSDQASASAHRAMAAESENRKLHDELLVTQKKLAGMKALFSDMEKRSQERGEILAAQQVANALLARIAVALERYARK
jgi:t-SNARE complex subunit (syntaxin)